MTTLIALLSSGKGTWLEVIKIINAQGWEQIFLITNKFGQDNFKLPQENVKLIVVDFFQEIPELIKQIKKQILITDFEVALNLASGSGKEHMALLETVLELGLNFRLVTMNKENKMESLGINR